MNEPINLPVAFVPVVCCACGTWFAMTQAMHNDRLDDHEDFFCPCGHSQHYMAKCRVCGKRLRDKAGLAGHMRRMHATPQ